MSWSDSQTAAQMRDAIEQIASGVVDKIRPDTIVGKVFSINRGLQKADILLPGETVDNLLVARFALDKIPTEVMATNYASMGINAPGDIVRLWGKAGSYFILDFISGSPESVEGTHPGTKGFSRFEFPVASDSWSCQHSFNTTSITVTTYDEFGSEIQGDVQIVSNNLVRINWGGQENGYALVEG